MRSVFAHLKNTNKETVRKVLDNICDQKSSRPDEWLCLKEGDPILYVGFYSDYQEYETDEWRKLVSELGCEPEVTVVADVSGRHSGRKEVIQFLKSVMEKFDGVIQDDSDEVWTLNEVFSEKIKNNERFFQY